MLSSEPGHRALVAVHAPRGLGAELRWQDHFASSILANMNKLMCILFLLGAIGSFGLSQRQSFKSQSQTRTGAPVGEERTIQVTAVDRVGYLACGVVCVAGFVYFV